MKRWSELEVLDRVTLWLIESLAFVENDMLTAETPCGDWNVGQLLDHIAGGNWFTIEILNGSTAPDALASARAAFTDVEGSVRAVASSAATQLEAFQQAGALDRHCDHVAGELSGEQVLRLRVHDLAIHVWDLLQAVNPNKGLDPVYVRWAIAELAQPDSLAARHMATGFAKPTKSYELLLAFGRRRESRMRNLR